MKNQVLNNNGVIAMITVGLIEFSRTYVNAFQKEGTKTAEIKQVINTHTKYPSIRVSNEKQDNLFSIGEYKQVEGGTQREFDSTETRVAWLNVPLDTKDEEVKARLEAANKNGACIYRVLSSSPILTSDQQRAIENHIGNASMDAFANAQVSRYPDGAKDKAGLDIGGTLMLVDGKPQYRRTFFSATEKPDEDLRGKVPAYISPEIQAELFGANVVFEDQDLYGV